MKEAIRILLFLFVLSFPLSMSAQTIDYLRPPKRTPTTTNNNKKKKTKKTKREGGMSLEDMYAKGYDFYKAKNYTQAIEWLKKAADKGHDEAQYVLGCCYDEGYGVTKDYSLPGYRSGTAL